MCAKTEFAFAYFAFRFSCTNLHRNYLAVALMDNPELVEWTVVSVFGDEVELVVAAALMELMVGERVPETLHCYTTIDLNL